MSSEVIFEGESSDNIVGNISIVSGTPTGILAWLVKNKIVSNAKQAEQILLLLAIVAAILAIIIYGLNFWHLPKASRSVGAPIPTTVTASP